MCVCVGGGGGRRGGGGSWVGGAVLSYRKDIPHCFRLIVNPEEKGVYHFYVTVISLRGVFISFK